MIIDARRPARKAPRNAAAAGGNEARSTSSRRVVFAIAPMIPAVATLAAWMLALVLHLKPMDFLPLNLSKSEYLIFRLIASFFGVLGFSVMFNSPLQLAATAGIIGAIANTTRLEP